MTYQLHCGDCINILTMLERESVDAIVTDPPYGLGFMGKDWDHGVPGMHFWLEALRCAKPGAHLLAFGGTRTFHRLAVAIEDAGWEIRDTVMWVYGCLSEDTEILTINGWEHYHKNIVDNPVLCYNIEDDSFHFDKPMREFCYENQHPAYRIQSDHTDQIVSRNHRVVVERGGRKVFAYAETLEQQESVPILESLSDLPEVIPNLHEGTSIQKQDLLARLRDSSDTRAARTKANERTQGNSNQMCSVRQGSLQAECLVKEDRHPNLFKSLQRHIARERLEEARAQGPRCMDGGKSKGLCRENERREQSRLEGWGNLLSQAWQLCTDKIRALPEKVFGYGTQRWVCDGAPLNHGAIFGQAIIAGGSSASHQPRSDRQPDRESNAVQHESRSQVIRGTQATVTPIEYIGKMWCVSVPTGAFVARRNGHIFITGNSGFPKSHDVSKAIDKEAGAEREVIGHKGGRYDYGFSPTTGAPMGNISPRENSPINKENSGYITSPATPLAAEWSGWGTALKPAWEPIIVARKPLVGTVAENVQRYGTGAINVDTCRIETAQDDQNIRVNPTKSNGLESMFGVGDVNYGRGPASQGRWPANLIHDGSAEVLAGFPMTNSKWGKQNGTGDSWFGAGNFGGRTDDIERWIGDTGSAARFFYCAKASKQDRDEGLEELEPRMRQGDRPNSKDDSGKFPEHDHRIMGGNHHPTVKPTSLMRYLCRLVTPPHGVILDPFMGSGSTGKAAILEGFNFIGVELEQEYLEIAARRIEHACSKVGIVVDQPMLIESRRQVADRPKQLMLL